MVKSILERMSGNEAVAHAIKQVEPDVMPAFPITPSTELPQFVSNFIANGEIDTEFIPVESEHSSMSAAIGASAAGARALTATSSCGLALMWEVLYVAASNRLPLCMAVVNRCVVRSAQYQQRAFRQYGSKRFRMDSDLCRKQSGSL